MSNQPRLYGIETEYSLSANCKPGSSLHSLGSTFKLASSEGLDSYVRLSMSAKVQEALDILKSQQAIDSSPSGFLSNGGRLYYDRVFLEYATPECLSALEASIQSIAGDFLAKIVIDGIDRPEDRPVTGLRRTRRERNTFNYNGVHENLSVPVGFAAEEDYAQQLASSAIFMASIFGSGGLVPDGSGWRYSYSPRLTNIRYKADGRKYLEDFLLRYEVRSEDEELARYESIAGDHLNLVWPMRARMVMTRAVLDILQADIGFDWPLAENLTTACLEVEHYGPHALINANISDERKRLKATEGVQMIAQFALDNSDKIELDNEGHQVLEEVIEVVDGYNADETSQNGCIESVARFDYITSNSDTGGLNCEANFDWDVIIEGEAAQRRIGSDFGWRGVELGVKDSPITIPKTRARARASVVAGGRHDVEHWHMVKAMDDERTEVTLKPLQTAFPA